jgi:hypothetical protein
MLVILSEAKDLLFPVREITDPSLFASVNASV